MSFRHGYVTNFWARVENWFFLFWNSYE